MNTLDLDESAFVAALSAADLGDGPAAPGLASAARRDGSRLRRRHRAAVAVGVAVCVGVGVTGVSLVGSPDAAPHTVVPLASTTVPAPVSAPDSAPDSTPVSTSSGEPAKATLDAPGWQAMSDPADDKVIYADGDRTVLLVWRPAIGFGPKWTQGDVAGQTTIDGQPATIFSEAGTLTVVGPVDGDGFLTLSSNSLTLADLMALAPQVHRP